MKDLKFVLSLVEFISSRGRFPGSSHHLEVRSFLKQVLENFGNLNVQRFETVLGKPIGGVVKKDLRRVEGLPYTNSAPGETWGELIDVGYGIPSELKRVDLEGKIVLVREGKLPFRKKEEFFHSRGVRGVIVFREEVDEIYAGVSAGLLPVLAIKPSEAKYLKSGYVSLSVETKPIRVWGENLWINVGEGEETLYLIAHYDTKPNTFGAIDNGVSVAVLVWLAGVLNANPLEGNGKVRILFTDLEEFGLLGAKKFVEGLGSEQLTNSVVVSVDTIGWHTPAVLIKDGEGFNSLELAEKSDYFLRRLRMRSFFNFTEGRSGRSDHIPFKQKRVKTLFFASNPFPYRHTPLDNFETVSPYWVGKWMRFLNFFTRNIFKEAEIF